MKKITLILLLGIICSFGYAQKSSLLVLGDLHYNLIEDHDMEWLMTKPDDYRQVTQEYTVYTEKHWNDFMAVLRGRILTVTPSIKAVVQTGDLSQGLAGNEEKAMQMALNTMKAVANAGFSVPWILTKGNHDITGPGGREAFDEYYLPMIQKQTNKPDIVSANYSYTVGNIQIVVLDPYDRTIDIVDFLEKEFYASNATIKFVSVHEPVIPVTERCWHLLRREPERRERLLQVIASNQAIVLSGHLHRYAVVNRQTPYGPIVQLMVNSVVRDRDFQVPSNVITEYGPSLADLRPDWQPETMEQRKEMLAAEAEYVTFFQHSTLPGYAIFKIDEVSGDVNLEYYAAFGDEPYDKINISSFYR